MLCSSRTSLCISRSRTLRPVHKRKKLLVSESCSGAGLHNSCCHKCALFGRVDSSTWHCCCLFSCHKWYTWDLDPNVFPTCAIEVWQEDKFWLWCTAGQDCRWCLHYDQLNDRSLKSFCCKPLPRLHHQDVSLGSRMDHNCHRCAPLALWMLALLCLDPVLELHQLKPCCYHWLKWK